MQYLNLDVKKSLICFLHISYYKFHYIVCFRRQVFISHIGDPWESIGKVLGGHTNSQVIYLLTYYLWN